MSHFLTLLFVDQSSPNFFWPNVDGVVVDNGIFRLSTWWSVPKIIAIKLESCQTLRRILDFFSPSQILGGGGSYENCTRVITPALRHVDWKKFHKDTTTRPGVIVAHTLNFTPNFKFSPLNFFFGGGSPSQLGCALGILGKSLARAKIWGGSTP